jgi:hypothetical protein
MAIIVSIFGFGEFLIKIGFGGVIWRDWDFVTSSEKSITIPVSKRHPFPFKKPPGPLMFS